MHKPRYRMLRVIEYVGPREWIDKQVELRGVKGSKVVGVEKDCVIREAIIGDVAELLPETEQEVSR
jgi:hypothetical protein